MRSGWRRKELIKVEVDQLVNVLNIMRQTLPETANEQVAALTTRTTITPDLAATMAQNWQLVRHRADTVLNPSETCQLKTRSH